MNQREQATIDLVINGRQAETSVGAVGRAVIGLTRDLRNMNEAEDPARYQALIERRNQLNQTYIEMQQRINGATRSMQNLDRGVEQADSRMQKFWDHVKSFAVGNVLANAISFGINALQGVIDGSQQAFEEAELTQTALQNKLKQTGAVAGLSSKALLDLQNTTMDLTGVDDDVIAKGEDMLLGFTNVRGVIYSQAIPAIVSYTAAMNGGKVTMEGIQAAALGLGKGLDNLSNVKKAARKMSIDLTETELKEIETHRKNNDIIGGQQIFIDALNKRYGNLAETLSQTDTGIMQRHETRIGNIQESIGKWMVSGKLLMANFLSPFLGLVEKLTATKLSDTLEDERVKMNLLTLEITDANTQHAERIKLINKLKEMYPDHLKNLDAEKTKNEEIVAIGEKLNEVYINRIILAKKDEEIEKQNQTTAELRMRRLELEQKMREAIEKLHRNEPELKLPANGTAFEKLSAMVDQYNKLNANNSIKQGIFGSSQAPSQILRDYKLVMEFAEEAEKKGNAMLTKRKELIKEHGIDENFKGADDGTTKPTGTGDPDGGGLTDAEKDAATKKLEEYNKQLQELRSQYTELGAAAAKGTVDELDAQLKVIDNKYQAIVEKLKKLRDDPHTKDSVRKELTGYIDQIDQPGGYREAAKDNATSEFDKKQSEGNNKQIADSFKFGTDQIDNTFSKAQGELTDQQNGALDGITDSNPEVAEAKRLEVKDLYAQKEYELEQQHLEALKKIYAAYGVDTSKLDKSIADNTIKENNRAAKAKLEQDKAADAARKQISQMERDGLQQGAEFFMSILDKRSAAYAAALVVDKAVAIANVIIKTQESIAAFTATHIGIPIVGAGLVAGYTTLAHVQEAISIATIAAQTISQVSGAKKYAEGGHTGMATSNDPSGFVNVPTLFRSKYIAGEAGGEWIAPNWMLKNPYTANVVGAMEALRQRGPGAVSSTAPAGGTTSTGQSSNTFDISALVTEMQLTREAIKNQEVYINYQNFTRDMDRIAKLKTSAGNNG